MYLMKGVLWGSITLVLGLIVACAHSQPTRRNVILMIVDDLRPELGIYQGKTNPLRFNSPNIDAFAKSALVFDKAFVNYGSCNPSRNSMLTGVRPEDLNLFTKDPLKSIPNYRKTWGKTLFTLPYLFKQMGHVTTGFGKIFHQERRDDFNGYDGLSDQNLHFCPRNALKCVMPQSRLVDGTVASRAIQYMKTNMRKNQGPFFLALGFHRPHVAYSVPEWAFNRTNQTALLAAINNPSGPHWFDPSTGIPANENFPNDQNKLPAMAGKSSTGPVAAITLNNVFQERLWYSAAVNWVDYCIGRVLNFVDSNPTLSSQTLIVLWGDNGLELGEYGSLGKSSPFETTAKVPVMFRVPWMSGLAGKRTSSILDSIDIGSTILQLVSSDSPKVQRGLVKSKPRVVTPPPTTQLGDGLSQVPLLKMISNSTLQSNSSFCYTCLSVTTNARCYGRNRIVPCETLERRKIPLRPSFVMFSLRTPTHRYVEIRAMSPAYRVDWTTDGLRGRALFSHARDADLEGFIDGSKSERMNLAPCESCTLKARRVVIVSSLKFPLLDEDSTVLPYESYFPPELDALPSDIALSVIQHAWSLRSLIRDKAPVCSGHGLINSTKGDCTCFAPWTGPTCNLSDVFPA